MRLISTLAFSLLVFFPAVTFAQQVRKIELINCGEIEPKQSIAQQDEPQTISGHVNVMDALETPKFKPGCPLVRAKIGTRFGIQVQVQGDLDGFVVRDLTTRVTHPSITNPSTGKTGIVDEWASPMNIGYARYAGWTFDESWELAPGAWKIEILHKGVVLVSKEFTVEVAE
jgi:hypothetical protein